ncbi:putative undecaprenyl-phosphate N-acetylglucosaminyl 1-phosphate transferase [Tepidimonas sediminis]|uniref:Putative undecaprenyl-phosphate N-acetylglucosaminyl 1-phosphate transferase n=1 Tax=Tepidimonas sediminis TaxID=2588941 RepID=A0A554WHE4_9BURK|nr:putative undecaprenyl-phosphate N-acetylglucosaminyl 1-phosphate transferase [Tepidimonas sediminis]
MLPRLGVPGVDALLALWPLLAWAVTLVAVAGVANAVNIIDGFNGLAAATSMLMFAAFGYVAWALGDAFIVQVCLAMIGALAGFFVWNYPRGLIFLGDGGAYLVGFLLAEVAVLLVVRHPQLSPWFCLLVCAYPITETLFSIYRRWRHACHPGMPDRLHLHSLICRRVLRGASRTPETKIRRNSATSPYLWGLTGVAVLPAVLAWRQPWAMVLGVAGFVAVYVALYCAIVRMRTPSWLRRRLA